jgi:hypothetical protein
MLQGSARSQEPRSIERIFDFHPELSAISEKSFDLLTKVSDAKDNSAKAGFMEQIQLVTDERLARDLQQRFRDRLGFRSEARSKPAGQDSYRPIS